MPLLNSADMSLWQSWKLATTAVHDRVVEEISAATGLSEPDFGVLTRVTEIGGGSLRQNELAASMGWHRARLSHHLTRMEQRGLLVRAPSGDGVLVTLTETGRTLARTARPIHAAAVRRHLVDRLPADSRAEFTSLLQRLPEDSDNH